MEYVGNNPKKRVVKFLTPFLILAFAFIIGIGVYELFFKVTVYEQPTPQIRVKGIKGYTTFNQWWNPFFDFTFEYPKNWKFEANMNIASNLERLAFISISGPRNKLDTKNASIMISKVKIKPRYKTLDQAANEFVKIAKGNGKESELKFFYDKGITLGKRKARWYAYSYQSWRPYKPVRKYRTREEKIIVKKGNYFYLIDFSVDETEYDKYKEAFLKVKGTFQFKN